MTKMSYQYHVYNENMSFIVSVPVKEDDYAELFAKRVAIDFYDYTKEETENVKVDYILEYWIDAAINLKLLKE